MIFHFFILSFLLFHSLTKLSLLPKYQSLDGSSNNLKQPSWGQSKQPFSRSFATDYSDNVQQVNQAGRPTPREISNRLASGESPDQPRSALNAGFGQFVVHDMGFMITRGKYNKGGSFEI
jgi:hypothetical protein